MYIGDLVRILRAGTLGVVIGFDIDDDPIVRTFEWYGHPNGEPEFEHAVEVVSENR
jgi:hypothetical protein